MDCVKDGDADPPARRLHARARLPAAGRLGDRVRHAHGPHVRPAGHRGPGARRRGAAPRRPVRGALPPDRHLLDRHEAAGEARPGAGRRPEAAAARRADQRARPGRPQRHARADRDGSARSSASRSWSPRTCSARSSGSAITWSRSRRAACCGRTRSTASPGPARRWSSRWRRAWRALERELTRRGLRPRAYQRSLLVPIGGDDTYDAVRDSVADLGLPLSRLEQRRHQVEELFRDDDRGHDRPWRRQMPADTPTATTGRRGRRHPRPRLPPLRRPAAWPRADRPGAGLAQLPVGVRLRPGREGQDRPGDRLGRALPARGGQRGFAWPTGNAQLVFYDTYQPVLRDLVMTIFVAVQAPELVSRDLRSRVLPLYFARPIKTDRLSARQVPRVHRRVPGDDRGPAAAALPGHDRQRARRRRGLGADEGAHPRAARRADVGGGAGRDQPVPRVA